MLKQHPTFVKQSIATIDCLLIVIAFYISYLIVSSYKPLSNIEHYLLIPAGFIAFYIYFAWTRSLFSILQFTWMKGLDKRVVMIFLTAGILGAAILYAFPDNFYSRTLYFAFIFLSFVFIYTEKLTLKLFIAWVRRNNGNITPIILFGRGRIAAQVNKEINSHPEWGLRVVWKLDLSVSPLNFENILKKCYVEEVFFCVPRSITKDGFRIDPYLQTCEEMGRPARVFINLAHATYFAQWEYHKFLDYPTLTSHTAELDPDQVVFKRIFDVFGAIFGMSLLLIMYPFFALGIKLSSKGPVFFKQIRVGKNGKRFVLYKFRSMYSDAEKKQPELMKQNEHNGAIFKIKDDPRITPIGRFIRRFSIDELPQFINVLRGEMSIVGTRPPTPDEVRKYQKWHHRRISIKPGITGMWQVSGRSSIKDFNEIVKLDLKYIDRWSIWLDVVLILKTVFIVFKRDTAY